MTFRFARDKFFQSWLPWLLPDKREHLWGSGLLFCVLYFLMLRAGGVYWGTGADAATWAFVGGLLWEIKDGLWNDGFSWKDLIADCVGIGIMWRMAV